MIKKPRVTLIFFVKETLRKFELINGFFCYCFYFRIYSVQFTDMYPFAEYEKYKRASKSNILTLLQLSILLYEEIYGERY